MGETLFPVPNGVDVIIDGTRVNIDLTRSTVRVVESAPDPENAVGDGSAMLDEDATKALDPIIELLLEFRDQVGLSDTSYQKMITVIKKISEVKLPSKDKVGKYRRAVNALLGNQYEVQPTACAGCRVPLRSLIQQRLLEAQHLKCHNYISRKPQKLSHLKVSIC
jgi:hypothetical protein